MLREGRHVIHDLSLRIGFPENVAIVGPNGAGKSTLLRLIARECYPVPAAATVCRLLGRERWNVFELRAQLGIVSNELLERFPLDATAGDVVASTLAHPAPGRVAEALERLGIAALEGRNVRELSSGELRRVTIARALVHRPRALILDEPASSLDFVAARDLRAAMRSLARDGVGIVLVTHQLEDVIPEIERVVFLKEGRLIADGAKMALLAREPLRRLFNADLDVEESAGVFSLR